MYIYKHKKHGEIVKYSTKKNGVDGSPSWELIEQPKKVVKKRTNKPKPKVVKEEIKEETAKE